VLKLVSSFDHNNILMRKINFQFSQELANFSTYFVLLKLALQQKLQVQTYAFLCLIDLSCLRQTSLVQFSTMPNKPVLIHLIVWILFQIQNIYTFKDDEHYCQGAFDSYSYCRRCPNSTMICEAPKSCRCDNIEIFNNHSKLKNA